jgi:hypothetical protein
MGVIAAVPYTAAKLVIAESIGAVEFIHYVIASSCVDYFTSVQIAPNAMRKSHS